MALFKPIALGKSRSGQLQEIMCPRCKVILNGSEDQDTFRAGDGVSKTRVIGNYHCPCGYQVKVEETYPVINMAIDG